MGLGGQLAGPLEPEQADVGDLSMSLIAAVRLPELLVRAGDVVDVVNVLEEDALLTREAAISNCLRFALSPDDQRDLDARRDQAARLELVQTPQTVRVELRLGDIDVLAADHPRDAGR